MSLLHFKTHIGRQLTETHIGDRRQHRRRFRRDIFTLLDTEEVCSTALFDILMLGSIEVHDIRIAQIMTFFTRKKTCSIVTADLHVACSTWSSAVLLPVNGNTDRRNPRLEVGTHRRTVDNQQGILRRLDPQDRPSCRTSPDADTAKHQSRREERNVRCVSPPRCRHLRSSLPKEPADKAAWPRTASDVHCPQTRNRRTFPVGTPESLQTLEKFNTVMQARSRHVHVNVLVIGHHHVAPFAIRIGVTDVEIRFTIVKTERTPIRIFHIFLF